jgi:hypothetical protein
MRPQDYAPRPVHLRWLLDSDPAIRWQVLRDLTGDAPDAVAAERARVAVEGWGAQLLAAQSPSGKWGGCPPEWRSDMRREDRALLITFYALVVLKDLGLDPASSQARRMIGRVERGVVFKRLGNRLSTNPKMSGTIFATYGVPVNGIPIVMSDTIVGASTYDLRATILHELAHLVGAIPSDGYDFTTRASMDNTGEIEENCAKALSAK